MRILLFWGGVYMVATIAGYIAAANARRKVTSILR